MRVTFSGNIVNKLGCWLSNLREAYTYTVWNKKPHKATCVICKDTIRSQSDMSYSPEQCGWERINKYQYICHRCLCHRNFVPYIQQVDKDEDEAWEKILNKTKKKV